MAGPELEGAHALDGNQKMLTFIRTGFRMMAPTHFFDNGFGGSGSRR